MRFENVQNRAKIDQNQPKHVEIRQIDPKISKKYASCCEIPTQDKKHGTCPQNPTAGPKTNWAAHA